VMWRGRLVSTQWKNKFGNWKRIHAAQNIERSSKRIRRDTYRAIDDFLIPRIVVDVDCDSAQGGDFSGELVELSIVLTFTFVGFGHGDGGGLLFRGSLLRGACCTRLD